MGNDLFLDYLPLIVFFIVYKCANLYHATFAAIVASLILCAITLLMGQQISKQQKIASASLLLLGAPTLLFHDPRFIQWKPSVVYWLLALSLLGSIWLRPQTFIEQLLGKDIALPKTQWTLITGYSALFFFSLGLLNLWVASHLSMNDWVNFKLFGTLALVILYSVTLGLYLHKQQQAHAITARKN